MDARKRGRRGGGSLRILPKKRKPQTPLRRLLRRHFNPQNYYLTAEGLVFFFPMYAIAPSVEGIPTFLFPYDRKGPEKQA